MPYIIQGESPPLPRDPVQVDGVTYVPLRDLTETLGGSFDWDMDQDVTSATIAQWCAVVTVGSRTGQVNDMEVTFSAPIISQDGSVWVPADFFHKAFGYEVQAEGDKVSITNPNATATAAA